MMGRRQEWRQEATRGGLVAAVDKNVNDSGGLLLATRCGDNLSPSRFGCFTRRRNPCPYQELQPATSWRQDWRQDPPSLYRGG